MRVRIAITLTLRSAFIVFLLMASPAWAANPSPVVPKLASDNRTATAGFYHLKWQGNGLPATAYELQQAKDMGFTQPTMVYQGPDQGTLISGQENGQYFYRVRALNQGRPASGWSAPVTVTVRHHSSTRAFAFFGAGTAVFFATLALIISGARRSQREEAKR